MQHCIICHDSRFMGKFILCTEGTWLVRCCSSVISKESSDESRVITCYAGSVKMPRLCFKYHHCAPFSMIQEYCTIMISHDWRTSSLVSCTVYTTSGSLWTWLSQACQTKPSVTYY